MHCTQPGNPNEETNQLSGANWFDSLPNLTFKLARNRPRPTRRPGKAHLEATPLGRGEQEKRSQVAPPEPTEDAAGRNHSPCLSQQVRDAPRPCCVEPSMVIDSKLSGSATKHTSGNNTRDESHSCFPPYATKEVRGHGSGTHTPGSRRAANGMDSAAKGGTAPSNLTLVRSRTR